MQLLIFLIISTLLIVKPTVNGLFLSEIGVERLPLAFLLVALFATILSTIYARFLGRASLNQIILTTLVISILLFICFGALLQFNLVGGWILYAFYVWVAIFGVLMASQFWVLANVVFNVREAKRLFGFIGAGAIAGGIFGGYFTTLTAEWIGSEQLPFVGALFLSLCIPLTIYLWNKNVLSTQTTFQRRKKIAKTAHPFQLIRKSPHLTFLAGIIGLSVIVAKLVDYQFSAIASSRISDPDELTAFFGFWFSNFNVLSLVVQLILTRRIVGMLGVGSSLFFLPLGILVGALLVFFIPELWAAIFIKMSDGSLKQSINKAAVELLSLPVPTEIKKQTKTYIDVVVDSVATGFSGLILIFLVKGLDLSTSSISLMVVAFILLWLFLVFKVRKSYLQSFRLHIQKVHQNGSGALDLTNESVIKDLKQVLEIGSENQILYVLNKLKLQPDNRFAESFLKLLLHPSDAIKEESIRNLYFLKNENCLEAIRSFTHYPSQKVKVAAFDYLISRSEGEVMKVMEIYLNDEDDKIKLAALVSLAEESRDNPVLKEKFDLENRLRTAYYDLGKITDSAFLIFHKKGLLKALGLAKIPGFFPFIEQFFTDDNLAVRKAAIIAAGDTLHPHFIPQIIQFLAEDSISDAAKEALQKYGVEIVQVLSKYVNGLETKVAILKHIPSVLEHFGTQAAADLLFELLKNKSTRVRLAALRSLNHLKSHFGYLNFYEKEIVPHLFKEAQLFQDTLSILYVQMNVSPEKSTKTQQTRQYLIQLLEKKLDNNLERIFRLLGLKYPPDEVISIYESIQGQGSDLRANALEYLDNILEAGLKKILIPLVETALLDNVSAEAIRELNIKIPGEEECYQLLLSQGDEEVKIAVQKLLKLLEEFYN